jgi:hypothetical protein
LLSDSSYVFKVTKGVVEKIENWKEPFYVSTFRWKHSCAYKRYNWDFWYGNIYV